MASRVLTRTLLSRPTTSTILRRGPPVLLRSRLLPRNPPLARFTSTTAAATATPAPSLSQRLKALSKEYGYSAVGVYLALSALDFPFCFLAVRYIGAERIGKYEDVVVGYVKPYWTGLREAVGFPVKKGDENAGEVQLVERDNWDDIEDAEREVAKSASIWTELALAYAIHKSFIFIRVPLTAAVTPKVVKVLRGWGWDIGKKGKPKIHMPPKRGQKPPTASPPAV